MPRIRLRWIIFFLVTLTLLSGITYRAFLYTNPPDQESAEQILASTLNANSYRYEISAYVQNETETREYFNLTGEKSGLDSQVSGTILGTEVNLYLVDDILYQQVADGTWQQHEVPDIGSAASLFSELDPTTAFFYSGLEGFEYIGLEELEEGRFYKIIFRPIQQGWIADYFGDIVYTLWISRNGQDIIYGEVSGVLKEDPAASLTVAVKFYDINSDDIVITAPVSI